MSWSAAVAQRPTHGLADSEPGAAGAIANQPQSDRQHSFRLDRRPAKDETGRVQTRFAITLLVALLPAFALGCGTLLLIGGSGTSAITFEAGELRSNEEVSLAELDLACRKAVAILGYEKVEATHEADRVHWKARTAGGDSIELRLAAKSSKRTELRIRVGVLGNEARARLILEQIHQSL